MASFSGTPRTDLEWTRVKLAQLDLSAHRVVVIGGTGGIGRALARSLASRGAQVQVVGQTFRDAGVPGITFLQADLSLMSEARRAAATLPVEELDLVVMTTGIIAGPQREETAEGLERDLAISYLSRLALVRAMAPRLVAQRGARPRVFVMGFPGTNAQAALGDLNGEQRYQSMPQHMTTVAGNEALVLDAARRHPAVDFFGLNPGLIQSNIRSNVLGGSGTLRHRLVEAMIGVVMMSPEAYAERMTPLLVSPDLAGRSPAMFNHKAKAIHASAAMTPEHVDAIIRESEALLARATARAAPAAVSAAGVGLAARA